MCDLSHLITFLLVSEFHIDLLSFVDYQFSLSEFVLSELHGDLSAASFTVLKERK